MSKSDSIEGQSGAAEKPNEDVGPDAFWALSADAAFRKVGSTPAGLDAAEAARRLLTSGAAFHTARVSPTWRLLARQFNSPIVMLLIGATALSMILGDLIDGGIILAITVASASLGFVQERGATRAVEELLASVRVHAEVLRDGNPQSIELDDIVVGDVLLLRGGDVVAADAFVLDSHSLLLDEAALTGESFPVDKGPGARPIATPLGTRTNAVWCGTHVVSGAGSALVMAVGDHTELGKVGGRLARTHIPTSYELGLRRFGYLLMRTAGLLVVGVFIVNLVLDRSVLESVLFSLALAVGLTPQLLPTIVTVTLAHGARQLARHKVIVKRLDAIEDIGSIDVLCTDKTGTLTDGTVALDAALDTEGHPSEQVRVLAWINATSQSGFANPIDVAIANTPSPDPSVEVIDELPYDFDRRLLSVLVRIDGVDTLITKGAVDSVVACCTLEPDDVDRARARLAALSSQGLRVLGVATRTWGTGELPEAMSPDIERELHFEGFLCFSDPPKADATEALAELRSLGVETKVITGDNRFAAAHVAAAVGLDASRLLTGSDLDALDQQDFDAAVAATTVFAEVDPVQKESIVVALRRNGSTVGYLGDGINDAPALTTADVGISVDTAVDVAKYSASVVLLDKDLGVLAEGIRQGRQVFANTIKYVQVTISANFGNVISMALATVFLPFLPLLPRQILLLNFLSDIPGTTIAADRVDPEAVSEPHGWDTRQLRNFMLTFGTISSLFDIATFVVLRVGFDVSAEVFRTGWFLESTASELIVMLVLRTRRPAWRSQPGRGLLISSLAIAAITVALPYSSLADDLGFARPSAGILAAVVAITVVYATATEIAKLLIRHRSSMGANSRIATTT